MAIVFQQTRFPLSLYSPRHRYLFQNPNPSRNRNRNSSFIIIPFTTTNTNSVVRFNAVIGFSGDRNLSHRSPPSPSATVDRQDSLEGRHLKLPEAFVRLAVSAVLFLCFGFCFGVRACSASSPSVTAGAPSSIQEEQTLQGCEEAEYLKFSDILFVL